MTEPTTYPACKDCGEPDSASSPDGRCRECDIEYLLSRVACRECLTFMVRPDAFIPPVPISKQHALGCSLRDVPDYYPRNEAEYRAVRKAKTGTDLDAVCPCGYRADETPGCGGEHCDHKAVNP